MSTKIPEVILHRTQEAIPPFRWASKDTGFRSKIGGSPTELSETDFPVCSDCGKPMTFYGQLDSLNDAFVIADCGLIAVFLCFDCLETKSVIVSG